jgi:hypothetical protein
VADLRTIGAAPGGGGVTLPTTWKQLTYAGRSGAADPNGYMVTGWTDEANGIQVTVGPQAGNFASPLQWTHLLWALEDVAGAALDAAAMFALLVRLIGRTEPNLTADLAVVLGLLNESASSGTVDGMFVGLRWSGGTRNGLHGQITNGVGTFNNGTAAATIRHLDATLTKCGDSSPCVCTTNARGPLDSSFGVVAQGLGAAVVPPTFGNVVPYLFLAVGRTAGTAGNETVRIDPYYLRPHALAAPT